MEGSVADDSQHATSILGLGFSKNARNDVLGSGKEKALEKKGIAVEVQSSNPSATRHTWEVRRV